MIRTSLLTSVFAGTCLRPFILKADYTTTRIQGVPFAWNSRNFVETVANISMLFLDTILLPTRGTFIDNRTYYVIDDYLLDLRQGFINAKEKHVYENPKNKLRFFQSFLDHKQESCLSVNKTIEPPCIWFQSKFIKPATTFIILFNTVFTHSNTNLLRPQQTSTTDQPSSQSSNLSSEKQRAMTN